jgi:hypothetical protein
VETIAQLILLLIAFALFRAYVQHGWPGVRAWWRSKLVGA